MYTDRGVPVPFACSIALMNWRSAVSVPRWCRNPCCASARMPCRSHAEVIRSIVIPTQTFRRTWDIRRAFDSVPREAMELCWARLGVPRRTARWIAHMDVDGRTAIHPVTMGPPSLGSQPATTTGLHSPEVDRPTHYLFPRYGNTPRRRLEPAHMGRISRKHILASPRTDLAPTRGRRTYPSPPRQKWKPTLETLEDCSDREALTRPPGLLPQEVQESKTKPFPWSKAG